MKKTNRFLLHILFVAVMVAAVIGLGNVSDNAYAAVNDSADGVYFAEEYAAPGKTLTVKYDGTETDVTYKWFIDGEQAECTADSFGVKTDHLQKTITAEVWNAGTKLGTAELFCSKLPVVYIETEGGQPVVTKDDYIDAQLHMQGNELYNTENTTLYTGATEIKGRGNSTWKLFDKKPYKLKLDKKTDLLGLGKNKHWVLLANYVDESGMRNMLAGDFATRLGVGKMDGTWVEVVMNGENLGMYMLCEHVRLSEDRVNVFDWETAAEDLAEAIAETNGLSEDDMDDLTDLMAEEDMSWISSGEVTFNGVTYKTADYYEDLPSSFSGGWLLEMDTGYDEVSKFMTDREAPMMFKSPEFIATDAVAMETVQNYVQMFEDALYSPDRCTEVDGKKVSYTELCDAGSFANYILASELLVNEVGYKSTYFQKDIDQPIVFGPIWDFDFSSSAVTPFGTQPATEWTSLNPRGTSGKDKWWIKEAMTDPYFVVKVREAYIEQEEYLNHVIADGGLLDEWYGYLHESGNYNFELWQYSRGFEADYEALDSWLTKRINWMDSQFATVDSTMDSMGIVFSDVLTLTMQGDTIAYSDGNAYTATVGGDNFGLNIAAAGGKYTKANYYINSKYAGTVDLFNGKATVVIREEQLTEAVGKDNVITVWLVDGNGELAEQQYLTVKLTSDATYYNVVFNDMGGSYSNKVAAGNKVYLDKPFYQTEASVFEGWSDGENTYKAGQWLAVNGDVTLNAVWAICSDGTYTHKFQENDDVLTCTKEGCKASKPSGKTYIDIASCSFIYENKYYEYYTGSPVTPEVQITKNGETLVKGEDYTITYKNNIYPGYATYTVKGIRSGGYAGEVSLTYRILPRNIFRAAVEMEDGFEYTGAAIRPEATLTYNGMTLEEGKDYTVTYSNNVDYGAAIIEFTGIGNFQGTMTRTFYIAESFGTCTVKEPTVAAAYTGKAVTPEVTVKDGSDTLVEGVHYTVSSNSTKIGAGTATVAGIPEGGYIGEQTVRFKIRPAKAVAKVVNKTYNQQKVTWNKVPGATEYRIFRSTDNKNFTRVKTVKAGADRVYLSKNLKTGKTYYYKVRAVAIQKNGLKSTTYLGAFSNVVKAKPVLYKSTIKSVSNTAAKTATIKWAGINGANGYQIYRSTTGKAGSFKVIKTVKVGFGKTYKDTKLKKGKTYYYKVRAYRNVDGKKVYGAFSNVKSVKIKK